MIIFIIDSSLENSEIWASEFKLMFKCLVLSFQKIEFLFHI